MCKIGDFVIFDDALARVDKRSLDGWFKGEAYYDEGTNLFNWSIAKDAPLFTLYDFSKIKAFKHNKDKLKFTAEQKEFIKAAVYWCLAREGLDLSSLK